MPSTMDPALAKRQLSDINRGLSAINSASEQCDIAERCGVDCTAQRDQLELTREQLNAFKREYFPDAK